MRALVIKETKVYSNFTQKIKQYDLKKNNNTSVFFGTLFLWYFIFSTVSALFATS